MDTLTNYRSSPILRAYQRDLDARANINRSHRAIDHTRGGHDPKTLAAWRLQENVGLRAYEARAHRALWGIYDRD